MTSCAIILFAHAVHVISIRNSSETVQEIAEKRLHDESFPVSRAMAILDVKRVKLSKWLGVHVWPVPLWLFCAFFQTSSLIRRKYLNLHRWVGRLLLLVTVYMTAGYTMMFIAGEPILGDEEFYVDFRQPNKFFTFRSATVVFTLWWLFSGGMAFMYARRKVISKHRYWAWQLLSSGFSVAAMRVFFAIAVTLWLSGGGNRVMEKKDQDIMMGYSTWLAFVVTLSVTHFVVGSETAVNATVYGEGAGDDETQALLRKTHTKEILVQ
ncbi:hypothetical protein FGB62_336g032 [Gracilaria domingensis]|nr:hypothetical protein FGB62_336g032 [Gracilaria domingensis]